MLWYIGSILTMLDSNTDISNMNPLLYYITGWFVCKNRKYSIPFLILLVSSAIYRFNSLGALPSQMVGYIAGVLLILKKWHGTRQKYFYISCIGRGNQEAN